MRTIGISGLSAARKRADAQSRMKGRAWLDTTQLARLRFMTTGLKALSREARVNQTKATILDAAVDLFLEDGFEVASLNTLASRLGCSKETIYKYYTNKEGLFLAAIDKVLDDWLAAIVSLNIQNMDLRKGLEQVSFGTLRTVFSGKNRAFRRLIMSSAAKRPEIGHEYYDYISARSYHLVAAFLENHMKKGNLKYVEPERLAKHFWGMMLHNLFLQADCQKLRSVGDARIRKHVSQVVDDFLIGYGTP